MRPARWRARTWLRRLAALAVVLTALACRGPTGGLLEPVSGGGGALSDDLDRESLEVAAKRSLRFYSTLRRGRRLAFGEDEIAAQALEESLAAFLRLMEEGADLSRAVAHEFRVYRVTVPVRFTGYYEPVLEGRLERQGPFRHPIYRPPDDLVSIQLADFLPGRWQKTLFGRVSDGKVVPYFARAEIDGEGRLSNKGYEIAWVADPVELAFLHVQGSGRIVLGDGSHLRVGYAASNGRPYRSIGRLLVERGLLPLEDFSLDHVRRYLRSHAEARDEVLFQNERYIFFRPVPDGPTGSTGATLTPNRSIALDLDLYPAGALAYIRTRRAVFDEGGRRTGWRPVGRFVLVQDSGAGISGPQHADLFWGGGREAELAAGELAQPGELYFLLSKDAGGRTASTGSPPL